MSTATIDPVQHLADRAELADLVSRLGRWLDSGGDGDPAALFVEDARVATPGGQAAGRDALVAQARRNHDVPTQHVITDVLADVAGDMAQLTANLLVTFVDDPATPGAHRQLGETYAFTARRTAEGWRLASVTVRPVWRDA
jgi:hypothetical protein